MTLQGLSCKGLQNKKTKRYVDNSAKHTFPRGPATSPSPATGLRGPRKGAQLLLGRGHESCRGDPKRRAFCPGHRSLETQPSRPRRSGPCWSGNDRPSMDALTWMHCAFTSVLVLVWSVCFGMETNRRQSQCLRWPLSEVVNKSRADNALLGMYNLAEIYYVAQGARSQSPCAHHGV